MIREPVDPPERVSFSSLNLFATCPAKWAACYIDKVPTETTHAMRVGSAVHKVLEGVYGLPPGERTPDAATDLLAVVDESLAPDAAPLARTGVGMRPDADVVAVEVHLSGLVRDIPLHGYVDVVERVGGDAVIAADWKTGKRPNRTQWMLSQRRQVMLYACLLEANGWGDVLGGEVRWLREGHIDEFARDRWGGEAIGWAERTWAGILEACESGEFSEQTSPLCGWCPIVDRCAPGRSTVVARWNDGKNIGPAADLLGLPPAGLTLVDEPPSDPTPPS